MLRNITIGVDALLQLKSRFFLLLNPNSSGFLLQEDGSKIVL